MMKDWTGEQYAAAKAWLTVLTRCRQELRRSIALGLLDDLGNVAMVSCATHPRPTAFTPTQAFAHMEQTAGVCVMQLASAHQMVAVTGR